MDSDSYIEDLYRQFKEEVRGGLSMAHFDRDELLEVYDYACDLYDEYTKLQALMLGVRDYPLDREFRERKAYYLYDSGDTEGARIALEEITGDSTLKSLLSLRLDAGSSDENERQMSDILWRQSKGALNDEEIIKLIETAEELKLYDWLHKHYDNIKQCAEYPDTVMYELSEIFEQAEMYDEAVAVLEELTADQPFNEEYWLMLAEFYADKLNDTDKALKAAEYALAINPQSLKGRIIRAGALFDGDISKDEALEIVRALVDENPENDTPRLLLANIYHRVGRTDEAVALLRARLSEPAANIYVLEHLLEVADSIDTCEDVKNYIGVNSGMIDSEWLLTFVGKQIAEQRYGAAAALLYGAFISGIPMPGAAVELMAEMLYRVAAYGKVLSVYDVIRKADESGSDRTPQFGLLNALALIRSGRDDDALHFIEEEMTRGIRYTGDMFIQRLANVGCSYYYLQLRDMLQNRNGSIDDYDPFA